MSDEPSSALPERVAEQSTTGPVRTGKTKLVVVASILVMIAATMVGLTNARAGAKPEAADPVPAPSRSFPGWQGLVLGDVDCRDDAATCQRILDDPALADKLANLGFAGDSWQLVAQVDAALAQDPDKRTPCGFDDQTCVAQPPSAAEIQQALTAAGISDIEVQTTGPDENLPNGSVFVGIRHGSGCVIVRLIDYTPVSYDHDARPDGTCLPA